MTDRRITLNPVARSATPPIPAGVVLLLASKSPRRRELLTEAGLPFRVIDAGVDDGGLLPPMGTGPRAWVAALAYLKATAAIQRLDPAETSKNDERSIVLASDTVVFARDRIVGQPTDADDARAILALLNGGEHRVMTGVALVDPATGRRHIFTDEAAVQFGPVDDESLDAYLAGEGWRGKAGAYNLAERLDDGWPIRFEGDPTTIMGLPMGRLAGAVAAFATETFDARRAPKAG